MLHISSSFVGYRLKELLRKRLKECGWRDELKERCKGEAVLCCKEQGQFSTMHPSISGLPPLEVIREKGLDHVTVETLVTEMTPFARSSVPEDVKRELLQEIRDFLHSKQ